MSDQEKYQRYPAKVLLRGILTVLAEFRYKNVGSLNIGCFRDKITGTFCFVASPEIERDEEVRRVIRDFTRIICDESMQRPYGFVVFTAGKPEDSHELFVALDSVQQVEEMGFRRLAELCRSEKPDPE